METGTHLGHSYYDVLLTSKTPITFFGGERIDLRGIVLLFKLPFKESHLISINEVDGSQK